jgi:predicted Zn-dependent peptidase
VIGYEEDLNRMSDKEAVEFYRAHYAPNHATVVVVGDVKAADVLAMVKRYYGALQAKPDAPNPIPIEPEQMSPRRKTLSLNTQVQKLMVAYHVPSVVHSDTPALEVMRAVLTGGKSSRLYRALVDSGITTSIDTYDLDDKDPSILTFIANCQKGRKALEAEETMLREIEKFKKTLASPEEIERAKNSLQAQFYDSLTAPSERASFLGHYETVADSFRIGVDLRQKIANVSADDIRAVARKYLDADSRSVVIGVQKSAAPAAKSDPKKTASKEKQQ